MVGQLLDLLTGQKWQLAIVLLFSLLASGSEVLSIGILYPLFETLTGNVAHSGSLSSPMAPLIEQVRAYSEAEKIRLFAAAVLIIMAVRQGLVYANVRISNRVKMRLDSNLRQRVFRYYLFMDMGAFNKETISELFTVLNNFTGYTGNLISCLLGIVQQGILLITYVTLLMFVSPFITLITLSGIFVTHVALKGLIQKRSFWAQRNKEIAVRINNIGFETLNAMKVIRLCAQEKYEYGRLSKVLTELRMITDRSVHYDSITSSVFLLSGWLIMTCVIFLSTYSFMFDGAAGSEKLLLYIFILSRLMGPAGSINSLRLQIVASLPSTYRLLDFLKQHPDDSDKLEASVGQADQNPASGTIVFQNVSYSYASNEPKAIDDVSFTIERGKLTAIVGPSGSGKTTIVDLLTRLHEPTEGTISSNGTNIREVGIASWRHGIAVVSQDTYLFNDSALENIRYGRLDAMDEEVVNAAQKANADEFLTALPEGYHTILGERGVRLSGGQAQRIAIARAFLSNPKLLVLDEATSAQDSESELQIRLAVERLSENRTVLIIAHRLSTVMSADKIVFLEKGRIVESGLHAELIALDGRYANFVRLQDLGATASEPLLPLTEKVS